MTTIPDHFYAREETTQAFRNSILRHDIAEFNRLVRLVDRNALHACFILACSVGNLNAVKSLLSLGVDDKNEHSPYKKRASVCFFQANVVQHLIDTGLDTRTPLNEKGEMLHEMATRMGNTDVAECLLGNRVHAPDETFHTRQQTILDAAQQRFNAFRQRLKTLPRIA